HPAKQASSSPLLPLPCYEERHPVTLRPTPGPPEPPQLEPEDAKGHQRRIDPARPGWRWLEMKIVPGGEGHLAPSLPAIPIPGHKGHREEPPHRNLGVAGVLGPSWAFDGQAVLTVHEQDLPLGLDRVPLLWDELAYPGGVRLPHPTVGDPTQKVDRIGARPHEDVRTLRPLEEPGGKLEGHLVSERLPPRIRLGGCGVIPRKVKGDLGTRIALPHGA